MCWEIQVKTQLGKLHAKRPLAEVVREQRRVNQVRVIPISLKHVLLLQEFPLHHRDPFDRLLISQARIEGATILSRDPLFAQYDVNVAW